VYQTEVKLFYKTYIQEDVIEQWTEIKNLEKGTITLQKYASANLYLNAEKFYLTNYYGNWAQEMRPKKWSYRWYKSTRFKIGTRTNLFEPPTFTIALNKASSEDEGEFC
jgi:alpha-galactosidase